MRDRGACCVMLTLGSAAVSDAAMTCVCGMATNDGLFMGSARPGSGTGVGAGGGVGACAVAVDTWPAGTSVVAGVGCTTSFRVTMPILLRVSSSS